MGFRQGTDFVAKFLSLISDSDDARHAAWTNRLDLAFLEHRGLEPVPLQKLVELGPIAFG
jgi:hypothetical protein